jgi:hypothetical protein
MITACTVILPGMENILECMLQSLEEKASSITRVVVAIKTDEPIQTQEIRDGFVVDYISFNWKLPDPAYAEGYCHAIGLHAALQHVDTEYVMLVEPDVVFYLKDFDSLYMQTYEKYDLGIIGVSRIADPRGNTFFQKTCFGAFPGIVAAMTKTKALPGSDFLKGHLKLRPNVVNVNSKEDNYFPMYGKWLLQTPIPEFVDEFPNPKGVFDPGCNLWLWFRDKRWLSFHQKDNQPLTATCNASTYNKNNFDLPEDTLGNEPLLFHSGHGHADLLFKALENATGRSIPTTENLCSCVVCKRKGRNRAPTPKTTSLVSLAKYYPTDKLAHGFLDVYETYFKDIQASKMLEIGLYKGQSHLLWKEYFPKAEIHAIDNLELDVSKETAKALKDEIHISYADQGNRQSLRNFIGKMGGDFDIIIDDGGHLMHQQQISLSVLLQYVKSGGLYIIEDLHTSFMRSSGINNSQSNITYKILKQFLETGKIDSPHLTSAESNALEKTIKTCKIFHTNPNNGSIVAIIEKV